MTNAIKVLLQMQSGFLQLESTLHIFYVLHYITHILLIFLFDTVRI
jgi:hypothetical protein